MPTFRSTSTSINFARIPSSSAEKTLERFLRIIFSLGFSAVPAEGPFGHLIQFLVLDIHPALFAFAESSVVHPKQDGIYLADPVPERLVRRGLVRELFRLVALFGQVIHIAAEVRRFFLHIQDQALLLGDEPLPGLRYLVLVKHLFLKL